MAEHGEGAEADKLLLDAWHSVTQQYDAYVLGKTYPAIHYALFDAVSPGQNIEWNLAGNQPMFINNKLQDDDMKFLCEVLEKYEGLLHTLNLSYNQITHVGLDFLLPYIKRPGCSMSHLDLGYTEIGVEGIEALAGALQFNRSITSLQLNGCKMGRKGGIALASMLQINTHIRSLGLRATDLDADSVIAMSTVLQANSSLACVDLSRPLIFTLQEEPTIHLSRMLRVNTTLQELHLSTFAMTDTGLEWICRALRENNSLKILDVSSNKLSRDGAGHLGALLKDNPVLQELDLSYNRIEDEGLVWLSKALASNTHLLRLDVRHNSIGDVGLCALATALETNFALRRVTIWGNTMGEPTCLAFYELLRSKRLLAGNTDVEPYMVDGVNYLAQTEILR